MVLYLLQNNDCFFWNFYILLTFFLKSDDEDCAECDVILESLENIDDEADLYGIDFVKNEDPSTAKHYHIYNTPALVYFRRQNPVTFEGDLTDEEAILDWLTSQEVFSIGDEIEEVNRKMLEKLLEENDFVAVYFCKYRKAFNLKMGRKMAERTIPKMHQNTPKSPVVAKLP